MGEAAVNLRVSLWGTRTTLQLQHPAQSWPWTNTRMNKPSLVMQPLHLIAAFLVPLAAHNPPPSPGLGYLWVQSTGNAGSTGLNYGDFRGFLISSLSDLGERTLFQSGWSQFLAQCFLDLNCCFLTCIQVSQEKGQVVWYSHHFKNFPVCCDPQSQRL